MIKCLMALAGIIVLATAAAFGAAAEVNSTHPVGFQLVAVPDQRGAPLSVGIWYPTTAAPEPRRVGLVVQHVASEGPIAGTRLPLVVISHGNQGAVGSHADTAMALADAGFVVAAPVHTGDNFADQSAVGSPNWFVGRARDVTMVIDYMVQSWPAHSQVDANRIGLFGFSAGGTTALIAVGGELDLAGLSARCAMVQEFACTLWKPSEVAPGAPIHDQRIKAAVIAAPGYGFAFLPDGVKNIAVPVQLWNGQADTNVPAATNAAPLRDALGSKVEYHLVPGAQHFSFIVPCTGPPICNDTADFNRTIFHKTFNESLVRFFKEKLG